MSEEHPEELTETSTEPPVSEREAAVAAAVPLDLILRILDEQTALAEQIRNVAGNQGRMIEPPRTRLYSLIGYLLIST